MPLPLLITCLVSLTLADDAIQPASTDVLRAWARPASVVVEVEVVEADAYEVNGWPHVRTRVTVDVGMVLRDRGGAMRHARSLTFDVPGGETEDLGILTSLAPILHAGEHGILALRGEDAALLPVDGSAFLPMTADDLLTVCVAPDPTEARTCDEDGLAILNVDATGPSVLSFHLADLVGL